MLVNVQALRAAAAFFVVFVHLEAFARLLGLAPGAFGFGNAGVDVFFVISGLIMVVTTRQRRPTGVAFLTNRVVRIVPFYWLITFLVFAVALTAPQLLQSTYADPYALLRSLAFLPFRRRDGLMEPIVFVGWTLDYEMAFYTLFALGLTFRRRAVGFVLTLAVLVLTVAIGAAIRPKGDLWTFYSAPIMLEFALGMVIGAASERLAAIRVPPVVVLAVDALMLGSILAAPLGWPKVDRLFAFGLPGAVLVLSAVYLERRGWALRAHWMRRLGDASFATYLTHFFVTQAIVKCVTLLRITSPPVIAAILALTFVLVALVGFATHKFVERPLNVYMRQWLTVRTSLRSPTLPPTPQKTKA